MREEEMRWERRHHNYFLLKSPHNFLSGIVVFFYFFLIFFIFFISFFFFIQYAGKTRGTSYDSMKSPLKRPKIFWTHQETRKTPPILFQGELSLSGRWPENIKIFGNRKFSKYQKFLRKRCFWRYHFFSIIPKTRRNSAPSNSFRMTERICNWYHQEKFCPAGAHRAPKN